jgi:hypothetical protein
MKKLIPLFTLILIGCQSKLQEKYKQKDVPSEKNIQILSQMKVILELEKHLFDYNRLNCESFRYISKLEEIPNADSNAYKLTISSKDSKRQFSKILNTRPGMSQINYCNDLYTVVGFSCGGPCYSQVFVSTDENKPTEQFDYSQKVKNNPNFIVHIQDEEFKELIVHNFENRKELLFDISDNNYWNYGQMDSIVMKNESLFVYYMNEKDKAIKKEVNLKPILK